MHERMAKMRILLQEKRPELRATMAGKWRRKSWQTLGGWTPGSVSKPCSNRVPAPVLYMCGMARLQRALAAKAKPISAAACQMRGRAWGPNTSQTVCKASILSGEVSLSLEFIESVLISQSYFVERNPE